VVVNCAGRTRSIIGTQSLINAGFPNRVLALRNGTIGWTLAGLALDHGQDRRPPEVPAELARRAKTAAMAVAGKVGVRHIGGGDPLADEGRRTVYRLDVRSPGEYTAGHLAGFRSAPGGQLVQETDWFAPVRGALIVLADDGGGRAEMTASWLAQMGWDVSVLQAGPSAPVEAGPWTPALPALPEVRLAGPDQVDDWLRAGQALVLDVDTSRAFLAGHVPGAAWALRTDLSSAELLDPVGWPRRLVLTSADGTLAAFATADVAAHPGTEVTVLAGGTGGWSRSGRPLRTGQAEMLSPPVDVYRRPYEGTGVDAGAMRAYLEWEYGLVAQLERDGTHGFTVLARLYSVLSIGILDNCTPPYPGAQTPRGWPWDRRFVLGSSPTCTGPRNLGSSTATMSSSSSPRRSWASTLAGLPSTTSMPRPAGFRLRSRSSPRSPSARSESASARPW
jgi:rhodanese-related sulfurtransferase